MSTGLAAAIGTIRCAASPPMLSAARMRARPAEGFAIRTANASSTTATAVWSATVPKTLVA